MDDLIKRLRSYDAGNDSTHRITREAANEIARLRESLDAYQAARVHDVDEKNWLRDERERLRAILRHALAFMYDDGGSRIVPEHVIETVRAALPDYADAGAAGNGDGEHG
jgi:hypothetical protein